jgi:hypothetical protein
MVKVQQNWWAWDELREAIENRPRRAWLLLGHLADLASTPELVNDFGAGPLEDFIRAHAPKYIKQIERRASEHDRFRRAIRWVRLTRANDPVSLRLLALGCCPIEGGLQEWQRI